MEFKNELAKFAEVNENQILVSPKKEMGDFCLPCFEFAKLFKKPPNIIAKEYLQKLNTKTSNLIGKMEVVGGYLNFFLNKNLITKEILKTFADFDFKYKNIGKGKTVCIDYCSANLAKYLHIGHMSTTVIGESLQRIYKTLGYKVIKINFLGDYGTPFGKMIVAIKLWGDIEDIKNRGIDAIQDLYVKFASNETEELMEKARFASKCVEDKVGEEYKIYKLIIDISIRECKRIINLIGIDFDDWRGESYYNDKMQPILNELQEKNITKVENGATIVDLNDFDLSVAVIKRTDGGSMYITRDLCAVEDRYKLYDFDEMLYVVAVQQKLHFAQLFKVAELLKKSYANKLKHISFGMFSTPEGKIASRKGKQAIFVDIYKSACDSANEIIKDKTFQYENKSTVAHKVAKSAISFSILKVERSKDKIFDLAKAISFDGETAPYLQYTYARCCSLIRNFEKLEKNCNTNINNKEKLNEIYQNYFDIFKIANSFQDTVLQAKDKAEPCLIARELLDLAQVFNKFYNEIKILDNNNFKLSKDLMEIVKMVKTVLEFGLPLVLVDIVSEM
ncbi:MAG: arginine--tRNA ligase [Clostridia bacterium]|nr:arginine--tRNA ligase [Clostridia bacterium]